jgi:iron uptake system component EfeO
MPSYRLVVALVAALALTACDSTSPGNPDGGGPPPDGGPADGGVASLAQVTVNVKGTISGVLDDLIADAQALQAAAPEPDDDGWNATDDAAALTAMKAAWKKARQSYEMIEGAIAVLFPALDVSTDQRYDNFLNQQGMKDDDLFDGTGVTGMHAIERILYSDMVDPQVTDYETTSLPGGWYVAPAFPSNRQEADDFKNQLVQRLIDDFKSMKQMFSDETLDPYAAYRGLLGSMKEQVEKVTLGATGEDESRYSRNTMSDLRANLAGGKLIFAAFQPLFGTVDGASMVADQINQGFDTITQAYAGIDGDGLPPVPEGWNPDAPTAEQLATPYGKLYDLLSKQSDPDTSGSLVSLMLDLGNLLGIPLDL